MTGDDIRPGDVILIDPDKPARPGDLACVTVSWGGGRGKVLRRIGEQGLALESSNPNYPPMILAPESKPVAEGRAVAVIRRLE